MLLALAIGEVAARARGLQPMRAQLDVQVDPEGARMYRPHDLLGYALVPDQTVRVTIGREVDGRGITFTARTNHEGRRLTSEPRLPGGAGEPRRRPQLWLLGCSYTFGWSLSDAETFPWLLQADLPEVEVVNFGVGGYGTLQSLLQLEEAARRSAPPAAVVLCHCDFHVARNTLSPGRRRALGLAWSRWGERRQPFVTLASDGRLERHQASAVYEAAVPFVSWLALSDRLDELVVERREVQARREDHRDEIARRLVTELAAACRRLGSTFFVAQLTGEDMVGFCRETGIPAAAIEGAGLGSNMPYDGHPNAEANAMIERNLLPHLRNLLTSR